MAKKSSRQTEMALEEASGAVPTALRVVLVVAILAAAVAAFQALRGPAMPVAGGAEAETPAAPSQGQPAAAPGDPVVEETPEAVVGTPVPMADVLRIGIVAGHWERDSGAVCPDGLTEQEVNFDIAKRVVSLLQALGYQVDLLEEFDDRLDGYQADALISIHADSCEAFPNANPPASGFKVASVEDSAVP
jgi:N-acetylmuramoyl-L-alanine amidase